MTTTLVGGMSEGVVSIDGPEAWLEAALTPGYRLAFAMLQDRQSAEDAVQEAAAIAWRRAGNVRAGREPLPWFLGIVANQCRRHRRRRHLLTALLSRLGHGDRHSGPEGSLDQVADLRTALLRLGMDQRAVVVLHFYLDLSLEAVAEGLGCPVGTVKSRLSRGLAALRADLRNGEDTG